MAEKQTSLWTRNFMAFFITTLFVSLGTQFLTATLPLYAKNNLGAQQFQVGYLLTAYSFAALFIRPLAGYAYDCIGRRKTYIVSLALFTLVAFSYPFAATFVMLVFFRFMHGLAFGLTSTGGGTIIGDIVPASRRGEGVGYFGLANTISMALGPAVGLYIIASYSYQNLFITGGIVIAIAFCLANVIAFPHYVPKKKKMALSTFFEKRVVSVAVLMLLTSAVFGGVLSYILVFGQEIGIKNGGTFFLVNSVGVGLTRLFSGRFFDKYGPKPVIVFGFSALAIGLFTLSISSTNSMFLLAALLYGFGNGTVMPTLQTMVINMVEVESRGVANSTFYAFIDVGIGGGSALLGYIAGLYSIKTMYLFSAIYIIIPFVFFMLYVLKDYERKFEQSQRQETITTAV